LERASRETFQGTPKRRLLVKDSIPTLLSLTASLHHPCFPPPLSAAGNIFFAIPSRVDQSAGVFCFEHRGITVRFVQSIRNLDMWRKDIISIPDGAICAILPHKHDSRKKNKLHNPAAFLFNGRA
jgi:hypothetical protein